MRYPTYSELIFINGRVLGDEDLQTGKKKVRDVDLLLAAEQRPQASAFGQDAYPTLQEKAAVLLHAISRNHPFTDGNKRTGTVGALFLLAVNGKAVAWDQRAAVDRIVNVAEGRTEWQDFARWMRLVAAPAYDGSALEADIARDTILIDRIIEQQKWLLDELANR